MASGGFFGKLLRVNLTSGAISEMALDLQVERDYLGGAGLATKLVYDEVDPRADALGPENRLVFMTGPLTGTNYPAGACYAVGTKSPLTNIWLDAVSSGYWGAELKRTGYDGLIVEGASVKPVYLSITNDKAEIRDAGHLWGQDALDVQGSIREELGDARARVAGIGPAGEKQVLLACVVNDEGRTASRGGAGAVMGAKQLKAIAVRGTKSVPIANEGAWRDHVRGVTRSTAGAGMGSVGKYGTAGALDTGWYYSYIPVQNWRKGQWKEGGIRIGGKRMADTILEPHEVCLNCPVKCTRWVNIEEGRFAMEGPGPEYGALAAFGTMCLNDNLESVCAANDICARYGLDAISTGSAIAFAMEAYERGILTKADTGGADLSWGNVDAILEVAKQIGEASGLGKLLGSGVKRASEQLGHGSDAFAVHVKGMEVPPYDPRAYFSMAVSYATGPTGACDLHGRPMVFESGTLNPEAGIFYRQGRFGRKGKGKLAKLTQDMAAILNSMIMCPIGGNSLLASQMAESLALATGFSYNGTKVMEAGERIVNLQRMFSLRGGLDPADDKLPPRLMEPTGDGSHAGRAPFLAEGLAEYYQERGWTANGRPTPEKLHALGLEFAIEPQ